MVKHRTSYAVYDLRLEGEYGQEVIRFATREEAERFISKQDSPQEFQISMIMAIALF